MRTLKAKMACLYNVTAKEVGKKKSTKVKIAVSYNESTLDKSTVNFCYS